MDPFKRAAQLAARETAENIARFNFSEVEMSRGESAYLIETPDSYLSHVEEGLGTKNLVADAMYNFTGKSYYDHIAQDTVAMIVNDMITLGALPLSVAMHLAVGISDWFDDEQRCRDLVEGWKKACTLARCVWGGGETPTLKDVVVPDAVVLSGSAIGIIKPKERLITANIKHGDAIVLIESSGIHANGLTMAREIANKLSDGYLTKLSDGRTYGETLLDPTYIYVGLVEDCLESGVDIHYTVNITGHGWRKLMRATQPFTYIIEQSKEKKVIIKPKNLEYLGSTLGVR
jgi:phosphoribosylformylglycinamidine cyclo-ligase